MVVSLQALKLNEQYWEEKEGKNGAFRHEIEVLN